MEPEPELVSWGVGGKRNSLAFKELSSSQAPPTTDPHPHPFISAWPQIQQKSSDPALWLWTMFKHFAISNLRLCLYEE